MTRCEPLAPRDSLGGRQCRPECRIVFPAAGPARAAGARRVATEVTAVDCREAHADHWRHLDDFMAPLENHRVDSGEHRLLDVEEDDVRARLVDPAIQRAQQVPLHLIQRADKKDAEAERKNDTASLISGPIQRRDSLAELKWQRRTRDLSRPLVRRGAGSHKTVIAAPTAAL